MLVVVELEKLRRRWWLLERLQVSKRRSKQAEPKSCMTLPRQRRRPADDCRAIDSTTCGEVF